MVKQKLISVKLTLEEIENISSAVCSKWLSIKKEIDMGEKHFNTWLEQMNDLHMKFIRLELSSKEGKK